jgi:dihydroorotase
MTTVNKKDILTIISPDDFHLHLRSGNILKSVIGMSASQMKRAIVMPNLTPPITNTNAARLYREEILSVLPKGSKFEPLMTLYLTDNTKAYDINIAAQTDFVKAAKLYPLGATTNSDNGVSDIKNIYPVLEEMQKVDMPVLIHGEVTRHDVDIFDREAVFIEEVLVKLVHDFPNLRIVLEHITSKDAIDFVLQTSKKIAATITAHHLLANRNDMLVGGIRPHYYCLPVLKRSNHQAALIKAATSGNPKFFLGTDSAPHSKTEKQSECGCAGVFSAPNAIELYATAFEKANSIDKLEDFASKFGADFYGIPYNTTTISLQKQTTSIAKEYKFSDLTIVPFMAGQTINWRLV